MLVLALTDPLATGLDEKDRSIDQAVYPNPASATLQVNAGLIDQYDSFTIYNILGTEIQTTWLSASESKINIGRLKNGLYTIRFSSKTGNVTYKFIKQ